MSNQERLRRWAFFISPAGAAYYTKKMQIKITSLRNMPTAADNLLYVEVEFIEAGLVIHRNDFLMQIYPTHRTYTGPALAEGEEPNPANYEVTATDVKAEILANISSYLARYPDLAVDVGQGRLPADYCSRRIQQMTEDTDPLGLRASLGVTEMVGVEIDPLAA